MLDIIQGNWKHEALTKHPEYALEIANIIGLWNAVEDAVSRYLEFFFALDMGSATSLVSKIQSSKGKIDFIAEAGRNFIKNDDELLEELEKLMASLDKRIRQRNLYAHAIYVTNLNEPSALYRSNRTENPFDVSGHTKIFLDELRSHKELMVKAFDDAVRFGNKLYDRSPKILQHALGQVQVLKLAMSHGHDFDKNPVQLSVYPDGFPQGRG